MSRKRSYKEKRPKRLGAMQVERTRHTEPSYFRALFTAGLIERKTELQSAFGTWQRVCADPEIMRLSMKCEAKISLPSVAAPYQHGAHVLAAMSEAQLAALKMRVGAAK
jgi:hypothetical protein